MNLAMSLVDLSWNFKGLHLHLIGLLLGKLHAHMLYYLQKKKNGPPWRVGFNHKHLGFGSFIAYMVQTIMIGLNVGLGLIMVQTMAKHMRNEMQFTQTNQNVGSMGHYNMGRRQVKGPHKLGHRTSQLVTPRALCQSERYSLSL